MLVILTACGSNAAPTAPTEMPTQVPVVVPPTAVPTVPAPIEPVLPSPTPEAQYAPFCQPGGVPSQCAAPVAEAIDKFCSKKIPFTLIKAPPGSTFEELTPGFNCTDGGVRSGSLMITCSGTELNSFDLKICNPACGSTTGVTDTGQCPQGYGYDAAQQCCAAALPEGEAGCIKLKVDIGTCP